MSRLIYSSSSTNSVTIWMGQTLAAFFIPTFVHYKILTGTMGLSSLKSQRSKLCSWYPLSPLTVRQFSKAISAYGRPRCSASILRIQCCLRVCRRDRGRAKGKGFCAGRPILRPTSSQQQRRAQLFWPHWIRSWNRPSWWGLWGFNFQATSWCSLRPCLLD